MISMHNYLIISALGPYQPEVINELSRSCTQSGCNLLNVKMLMIGKEVSVTLFLAGNWGTIAKMEAALPGLEQRLGLSLISRRTSEYIHPTKSITYSVQVSAIDKAGIINGLSDFLFRLAIPIEEMSAYTYLSQTGTRMASLTLKINVPDNIHLATLREQFMNYCDDNNLDAFLEPIRHL
jgi:glycine cleavage system transcriptional repressor